MKRFYALADHARTDDTFELRLDGRAIRTPGRRALVVPTEALADAVAAEWNAQGEEIDPATLPLTRLAEGAIDQLAADRARFVDRIAGVGDTDTLLYRAGAAQPELASEQARLWDLALDWARRRYDVAFTPIEGIVHRAQPKATLRRLREAVEARDDFALAALLVFVGLTDSLVLALALAEGAMDVDAVWEAANLEELWQERQWGEDAEATARRAGRRAELDAALRFHRLSRAE